MPIYEYQCTGCHHTFDLMQKVNSEPSKVCPHCSKDALVRLVSAPSFQLKGTGWYATDFKDKEKPRQNAENAKKDSDKIPAKDNSTSQKSTESKPAATPKVDKIEK